MSVRDFASGRAQAKWLGLAASARTLELADQCFDIIDRATALQAVIDGLLNAHYGHRRPHGSDRAERRKHVGVGAAGEQGEREEDPVQHVMCCGATRGVRRSAG